MGEAEEADEATQLEHFLDGGGLHPLILETKLKEFSEASKNELVARLARTFTPPPGGRLLMRLLYIRTPENEANLTTLYITNLHSPNEGARAASLHGLRELNHPNVFEFALAALRDDDDRVLFEACTILLPQAKEDPNMIRILQDVHAQHAGDTNFHMTTSLLEAHGIA